MRCDFHDLEVIATAKGLKEGGGLAANAGLGVRVCSGMDVGDRTDRG